DKPLGTAGSLHLLNDQISSTFFVSNCDILIDQDYTEILSYHRENKNEITLVSVIKNFKIPYGTIEAGKGGLVKSLKEKPTFTFYVNAGMYILEPHLLAEIPKDQFFHITDLIDKVMAREGRVGLFPVNDGAWSDIGEWDKYKNTLKKFGHQTW
ncbi:MAG: sugar phosphate nucleotidyltransferase, partial [Bacteroidota bacterium]